MFLWFPKLGQCVAEPQIVLAGNSRWTERHIQCIWYDSSLRPKILRTDSGEEFTIINPGTWNLEEGPDFLGAEIRFIKSGKVIRGDVELHVRPSDWVAHHHSGDENYSNLVMHVCWFGGYNSAPLPPHVHNVTLKEQILIQQNFSFEQIAITAYPHAILNETPPCGQHVANLSKEQMNNAMQMYRQFFEESGAGLSGLQEGIKGITESRACVFGVFDFTAHKQIRTHRNRTRKTVFLCIHKFEVNGDVKGIFYCLCKFCKAVNIFFGKLSSIKGSDASSGFYVFCDIVHGTPL